MLWQVAPGARPQHPGTRPPSYSDSNCLPDAVGVSSQNGDTAVPYHRSPFGGRGATGMPLRSRQRCTSMPMARTSAASRPSSLAR